MARGLARDRPIAAVIIFLVTHSDSRLVITRGNDPTPLNIERRSMWEATTIHFKDFRTSWFGRPELRAYYDVKVWVDTDEETRTSRLVARGENTQAWIRRWSAAEEYYFKNVFAKDEVIVFDGQTA